MTGARRTRIGRLGRGLDVTGAIIAIAVGVLVPVALASGVGIVALVIGESTFSLILGILVTTFASAAVGGAVIATVLLGRRARIARLQADLLANVTHELRTPLAAIKLHAQTLAENGVSDDRAVLARGLSTILRETAWLETMIDRVLGWRSAEKDRIALDQRSDPVGPAVEDAVASFRRMIDPGEVDLSVDVSTRAAVVHDHRAIASAVLNLMVNAYKYTGESKVIGVVASDDADSGEVVVSVVDNGIGIQAGEHDRIFDPFYRVDTELRSRSAGTGLGLAIVRHVVREHGGHVIVESERDAGSTFSIHLPFSKESR